MTNEVTIRLVSIGASIFIALVTITAVMVYYNMSRNTIAEIGVTDLSENYNENIKQVLYKDKVTGSELKNILQYFRNDLLINIWIDKYYYIDNNSNIVIRKDLTYNQSNEFNNKFNKEINNDSYEIYKNFMQNGLYDQKYKIEHIEDENYELYVKFSLIEK